MNIRMISGANKARLESVYNIRYRGVLYEVPRGFVFDGASIPSPFWSVLFLHPFHHKVRRAGLIHDYLYTKGDKKLADSIFRSILKEDGCNVAQRQVMYWAVRIFGHAYANGEKK